MHAIAVRSRTVPPIHPMRSRRSGGPLSPLRGKLQATAAAQLQLLNANLGNAQTRLSSSDYGAAPPGILQKDNRGEIIGVTLEGNVIDTLRKIAFNTAASANDLATLAGAKGLTLYAGVFGAGGWVGGRPHSLGGTHIEAEFGEHVTNRSSAGYNRDLLDAINAARGPVDLQNLSGINDNFRFESSAPNVVPITPPVQRGRGGEGNNNPELVAAVKENTEELRNLKKMVAAGGNGTVRVLSEIKEQISDSVDDGSRRVADGIRMTGRMLNDRASLKGIG